MTNFPLPLEGGGGGGGDARILEGWHPPRLCRLSSEHRSEHRHDVVGIEGDGLARDADLGDGGEGDAVGLD